MKDNVANVNRSLAKSVQSLFEEQELLAKVIEFFPYPIQIFSFDGTARMINKATVEMIGIKDIASHVGKYNVFKDPIVRELGFMDQVRQVLIGKTIYLTDFNAPYQDMIRYYLPVLEKPAGISVRSDENNDLQLRLTQPDSIMKYVEEEITVLYELDFKINDGPWKFNKNWDGVIVPEGATGYYESIYDKMNVTGYLNNIGHDERNAIGIPIFPPNLEVDAFDLQNNTYSFRFRYLYEYDAQNPATKEWGYKVIASPYSETAIIGKGQGSKIPSSLEAPSTLAGELKTAEDGQPYFHFTFVIPKSVEDANKITSVWTKLDWKIGSGQWATELANGVPFEKAGDMLSDDVDVDPIDEGGWGEINIKENTYYFRAFFELKKPDGSMVRSPFSNVVEIGTSAFYSNASNWAKPELQKAYDLGLIPAILDGADMTKPITREEFAELAVMLYEKVSNKKSEPFSPNPFTDTINPQILKAYKIGITAGTSPTTFSPKVLIDREQCAAMLFRTIKAIYPNGDYSITGVKDFLDQKDISPWAIEAAKYMSKMGIIAGDGKGNFIPKATTTAQQSIGYGMATREQAIAISVRTHDKTPEIEASGSNSQGTGENSDPKSAGGAGTKLPDGFPSDLIPIYEGGTVTSVVEKTFDGGKKGYLITIDHSGQKDSEVNGYYYSIMSTAEDLEAKIGMHSYYYGIKGGYWIEIDFFQDIKDEYSGYVEIGYYKM